jgi:hypothetical protein
MGMCVAHLSSGGATAEAEATFVLVLVAPQALS